MKKGKTMLGYILVGFVALIVLFVIIVSLRPAEFTIKRSITVKASPEKIFPHVNTLRQWEAWSPWAKLDPNAKSTFTGPDAGVDSAMAWDGNNQVGTGKMTIIGSQPSSSVRFRLDFEKPMKATNTAEFAFKAEGDQTVVTWIMSGNNGFVGKAFGLFVDCDKMVGGQFEQGLNSLKAVAEAN